MELCTDFGPIRNKFPKPCREICTQNTHGMKTNLRDVTQTLAGCRSVARMGVRPQKNLMQPGNSPAAARL